MEKGFQAAQGHWVVVDAKHRAFGQSGGQGLGGRDVVRRGVFDLQSDSECGTVADVAFHADVAAHEHAEALADGQSKAGAAVFARGGGIDLGERLEEPVESIGRNADTGVANGDGDHAVCRAHRFVGTGGRNFHGDGTFGRKLDGVVDEVTEHLAQADGVADQDFGNLLVNEVADFEFPVGGLRGEQVQRFFDGVFEVERLVLQFQFSGFDFRKIENVVDDGQEGFAAGAYGVDGVALVVVKGRFEQEAGHTDDAIHRSADFVRDGGEKFALGARGGVGLGFGAAEGLLRLDARSDVSFDGDEVFQLALFVAHRLEFELQVVFAAGFGVIDDVGGKTFASDEGGFE